MSAIAQARNVPLTSRFLLILENLLIDLRIKHGIKLGLAGLLALAFTQILALPHDAWAILTVLVMMLSRYVGLAAVKAITRVIGTIGGAMIGTWLVGNYTSRPAIFLPVLFVVQV